LLDQPYDFPPKTIIGNCLTMILNYLKRGLWTLKMASPPIPPMFNSCTFPV
jgi:hypothetical protein